MPSEVSRSPIMKRERQSSLVTAKGSRPTAPVAGIEREMHSKRLEALTHKADYKLPVRRRVDLRKDPLQRLVLP